MLQELALVDLPAHRVHRVVQRRRRFVAGRLNERFRRRESVGETRAHHLERERQAADPVQDLAPFFGGKPGGVDRRPRQQLERHLRRQPRQRHVRVDWLQTGAPRRAQDVDRAARRAEAIDLAPGTRRAGLGHVVDHPERARPRRVLREHVSKRTCQERELFLGPGDMLRRVDSAWGVACEHLPELLDHGLVAGIALDPHDAARIPAVRIAPHELRRELGLAGAARSLDGAPARRTESALRHERLEDAPQIALAPDEAVLPRFGHVPGTAAPGGRASGDRPARRLGRWNLSAGEQPGERTVQHALEPRGDVAARDRESCLDRRDDGVDLARFRPRLLGEGRGQVVDCPRHVALRRKRDDDVVERAARIARSVRSNDHRELEGAPRPLEVGLVGENDSEPRLADAARDLVRKGIAPFDLAPIQEDRSAARGQRVAERGCGAAGGGSGVRDEDVVGHRVGSGLMRPAARRGRAPSRHQCLIRARGLAGAATPAFTYCSRSHAAISAFNIDGGLVTAPMGAGLET